VAIPIVAEKRSDPWRLGWHFRQSLSPLIKFEDLYTFVSVDVSEQSSFEVQEQVPLGHVAKYMALRLQSGNVSTNRSLLSQSEQLSCASSTLWELSKWSVILSLKSSHVRGLSFECLT
jgi:hypothetical protein